MPPPKDYYSILGLSAPNASSHTRPSPADLRRAYKLALLAAHPDKAATGANRRRYTYTVDQVKEAYTVLGDANRRLEYDEWVLRNAGAVVQHDVPGGGPPSSDFVLGLEVLDLSDFDVLDAEHVFSGSEQQDAGGMAGEEERQMEWTRACRCGEEKGYRILEGELGDAEGRGETEVLVGCGGCSLWVRVGFEVEGEEEGEEG